MSEENEIGHEAAAEQEVPAADAATTAAGEPDEAPVIQEALLDLAGFAGDPEDEESDPAVPPLPDGGAADLPGDLPPGPGFFVDGQATLETGAGKGAASGGSGEYREPHADRDLPGLHGHAPPWNEGGDFAPPGFGPGAPGPAWLPAAGPAPASKAPIAYNVISGTPAGDRLHGTGDSDLMIGMPGNDRLYGGDRADWLQGGDGNDRLYGEGGADKVQGGDGNDTLYIDAADTLVDGGAGFDRVYVQGGSGVALNLAAAQVEQAHGNSGDDRFDASRMTEAVRLYGNGGDDRLIGGSANDRLYGHAGDDQVAGGDGADRLYGDVGADILRGDAGNDRLYGDGGADSLLGGEGNDRLYVDADDIRIYGGLGTDTVYVQTAAGVTLDLAASQVENAYGNDGDDTFDASGLTAAARLDGKGGADSLLGGSANDRLYGRDGDDSLTGGDGADQLYGDVGADVLRGGAGSDRLYGDGGADSLLGGEGNDRLYVDADDLVIDGGLGTDTIYVQTAAAVTLDLAASEVENAYGNDGDDTFDASGLTAAARLDGKGGDDSLLGGSANDRLYGDGGADSLLGGEGNDRLYVDADDILIDGGLGTDTVYVQTAAGVTLDLAASHVENAYGHDGGDNFDASDLTAAARLDGKGGDDSLLGGSANDRLYGRAGDDNLTGGDGNDYLYGHTGTDALAGGEGNDRLYGHDDADILVGGAGNDRLYGGGGSDSFVFSLTFNGDASLVRGPGSDRVYDFNTAEGDQLAFADVVDVDLDTDVDLDDLFALEADGRLEVSESGSGVVFDFNGGGTIVLVGLATGGIDSLQDVIDSGAAVVV